MSSGATATAWAVGVHQDVTGNAAGVGSSAIADLTNDGLISAVAHATAIAFGTYSGGYAWAIATATGVDQDADRAETATTSLVNSGDIVAEAIAYATGYGNHSAYASDAYAVGVRQSAEATGSGTSVASAYLDNTGSIDATAKAYAYASDDYALASAYATGVSQGAFNAEHSSAWVTNEGDIHVYALADADGTSAYAYAYGAGVSQWVSGNDTTGSTARRRSSIPVL